MNKKSAFFSMDALIALFIILLVILLVYPKITHQKPKSNLNEDLINVLSSLKIGEINNSYAQDLISSGKIKDMNKLVMEQIGEFYANNMTEAKFLAQSILAQMNTSENIGIWFGSEMIASKNSSSYEDSKNIEAERQVISGIEKGRATSGFIAKAWLKKLVKKKTSLIVRGDLMCGKWGPFHGSEYCGSAVARINYSFFVPENANINSASWLAEPSWISQPTTLWINGSKIFDGQIEYFRIFNITNLTHPGFNIAQLKGEWGGEDGASHIIVEYETPDLQTFQYQNIFPFNEMTTTGILYHEKALFIPDPISSMRVQANTTFKTKLEFRRGSQTVVVGTKTPSSGLVVFNDTEIKTALNNAGIPYSSLNNNYMFFILKIGTDNQANVNIRKNSYVQVNTSSYQEIPFGSIDINQKINIKSYSNLLLGDSYKNLLWEFYLPRNSIPMYADWQLGWISTGASSQEARANSIILYQSPPSPYLVAFSRFAYTNQTNSGVFREGLNNFTLTFGDNYGVSVNASLGSLLYFVRSFVNYGEAFEKAAGGTRTIEFEDGSSRIISIGNPADSWDPDTDAVDDAVERLLSQLDSDDDGKLDLIIDQDSLDIGTIDISGVPYIWNTEVQARSWS